MRDEGSYHINKRRRSLKDELADIQDPYIREMARKARAGYRYEKRTGVSRAEADQAEVSRAGRRIKHHERDMFPSGSVGIPGHRQYCINARGDVHRISGTTRANTKLTKTPTHVRKVRRVVGGEKGYVMVLMIRLLSRDKVVGHDRHGEELIADERFVKWYRLHTLVMDMFGPDKPDDGRGYYVAFKNGDRLDVRVKNLCWRPVADAHKDWRSTEDYSGERYWRRGQKMKAVSVEKMKDGMKRSRDRKRGGGA
jgi:hypothetical protein